MDYVKVLHCADLHLGAELSSLGGIAMERRQELLSTFINITTICRDEKVDLLLIAGDLFEGSNIDSNTVKTVKETLAKIPETIVAISPGNHDYMAVDSPYADNDWSGNVNIFKSDLEKIDFPDKGVCLWGAAFRSTYVTKGFLEYVPPVDKSRINICVVHGDLVSNYQLSSYNPVTPMRISSSGMDYIALGHTHKYSGINNIGTTWYGYSGCPEGMGFDELDDKGILIGTVHKGSVNLEFRPISMRRNIELRADITSARSDLEAYDIIRHRMKCEYGDSYQRNLYKVILEGALEEDYSPDVTAIAARLKGETHYLKVRDNTHVQVDLDGLSRETSLKGIFVRMMLAKIAGLNGSDDSARVESYRKAMYVGIKAFDKEVPANDH